MEELALAVSVVAPLLLLVVVLIKCLGCLRKKEGFKNFENEESRMEARINPGFIMGQDIDDREQTVTSTTIQIEPLPELLAETTPRKPKIACVEKSKQESALKLVVMNNPHPFPRRQLKYLNEIGTGWFGHVLESDAEHITTGIPLSRVIAKVLKDDATNAEKKLFLEDVIPYRELEHSNILRLLGQCTESTPYLIILEYAQLGDLKSFLRQQKAQPNFLTGKYQLVKFAIDAASGLACLHRHGYIHQDLAARNCLVMSNYTVKVGDYGIGEDSYRDDYYVSEKEVLPIRWMAPESLSQQSGDWQTAVITKEANIWSFGVLIWEVLMFGRQPYSTMSDTEVLQTVIADRMLKLSEPDTDLEFKDRIVEVMQFCWLNPGERPSIEEAHGLLQRLSNIVTGAQEKEENFEKKWNQMIPSEARIVSAKPQPKQQKRPLSASFESDFSPVSNPESSVIFDQVSSPLTDELTSVKVESALSTSIVNMPSGVAQDLEQLPTSAQPQMSALMTSTPLLEPAVVKPEAETGDKQKKSNGSGSRTSRKIEDEFERIPTETGKTESSPASQTPPSPVSVEDNSPDVSIENPPENDALDFKTDFRESKPEPSAVLEPVIDVIEDSKSEAVPSVVQDPSFGLFEHFAETVNKETRESKQQNEATADMKVDLLNEDATLDLFSNGPAGDILVRENDVNLLNKDNDFDLLDKTLSQASDQIENVMSPAPSKTDPFESLLSTSDMQSLSQTEPVLKSDMQTPVSGLDAPDTSTDVGKQTSSESSAESDAKLNKLPLVPSTDVGLVSSSNPEKQSTVDMNSDSLTPNTFQPVESLPLSEVEMKPEVEELLSKPGEVKQSDIVVENGLSGYETHSVDQSKSESLDDSTTSGAESSSDSAVCVSSPELAEPPSSFDGAAPSGDKVGTCVEYVSDDDENKSSSSDTSSSTDSSNSGRSYECEEGNPHIQVTDLDADDDSLNMDKQHDNSFSDETTDSDEDMDLKIASELYLSKGVSSPQVFERPPLETIPEDVMPSPSDTSSVDLKFDTNFDDVFASQDNFEWDDFMGESIVGRDRTGNSPKKSFEMSDWMLEGDSLSNSSMQSPAGSVSSDILGTSDPSIHLSTASGSEVKRLRGRTSCSYVSDLITNRSINTSLTNTKNTRTPFYSLFENVDLDNDSDSNMSPEPNLLPESHPTDMAAAGLHDNQEDLTSGSRADDSLYIQNVSLRPANEGSPVSPADTKVVSEAEAASRILATEEQSKMSDNSLLEGSTSLFSESGLNDMDLVGHGHGQNGVDSETVPKDLNSAFEKLASQHDIGLDMFGSVEESATSDQYNDFIFGSSEKPSDINLFEDFPDPENSIKTDNPETPSVAAFFTGVNIPVVKERSIIPDSDCREPENKSVKTRDSLHEADVIGNVSDKKTDESSLLESEIIAPVDIVSKQLLDSTDNDSSVEKVNASNSNTGPSQTNNVIIDPAGFQSPPEPEVSTVITDDDVSDQVTDEHSKCQSPAELDSSDLDSYEVLGYREVTDSITKENKDQTAPSVDDTFAFSLPTSSGEKSGLVDLNVEDKLESDNIMTTSDDSVVTSVNVLSEEMNIKSVQTNMELTQEEVSASDVTTEVTLTSEGLDEALSKSQAETESEEVSTDTSCDQTVTHTSPQNIQNIEPQQSPVVGHKPDVLLDDLQSDISHLKTEMEASVSSVGISGTNIISQEETGLVPEISSQSVTCDNFVENLYEDHTQLQSSVDVLNDLSVGQNELTSFSLKDCDTVNGEDILMSSPLSKSLDDLEQEESSENQKSDAGVSESVLNVTGHSTPLSGENNFTPACETPVSSESKPDADRLEPSELSEIIDTLDQVLEPEHLVQSKSGENLESLEQSREKSDNLEPENSVLQEAMQKSPLSDQLLADFASKEVQESEPVTKTDLQDDFLISNSLTESRKELYPRVNDDACEAMKPNDIVDKTDESEEKNEPGEVPDSVDEVLEPREITDNTDQSSEPEHLGSWKVLETTYLEQSVDNSHSYDTETMPESLISVSQVNIPALSPSEMHQRKDGSFYQVPGDSSDYENVPDWKSLKSSDETAAVKDEQSFEVMETRNFSLTGNINGKESDKLEEVLEPTEIIDILDQVLEPEQLQSDERLEAITEQYTDSSDISILAENMQESSVPTNVENVISNETLSLGDVSDVKIVHDFAQDKTTESTDFVSVRTMDAGNSKQSGDLLDDFHEYSSVVKDNVERSESEKAGAEREATILVSDLVSLCEKVDTVDQTLETEHHVEYEKEGKPVEASDKPDDVLNASEPQDFSDDISEKSPGDASDPEEVPEWEPIQTIEGHEYISGGEMNTAKTQSGTLLSNVHAANTIESNNTETKKASVPSEHSDMVIQVLNPGEDVETVDQTLETRNPEYKKGDQQKSHEFGDDNLELSSDDSSDIEIIPKWQPVKTDQTSESSLDNESLSESSATNQQQSVTVDDIDNANRETSAWADIERRPLSTNKDNIVSDTETPNFDHTSFEETYEISDAVDSDSNSSSSEHTSTDSTDKEVAPAWEPIATNDELNEVAISISVSEPQIGVCPAQPYTKITSFDSEIKDSELNEDFLEILDRGKSASTESPPGNEQMIHLDVDSETQKSLEADSGSEALPENKFQNTEQVPEWEPLKSVDSLVDVTNQNIVSNQVTDKNMSNIEQSDTFDMFSSDKSTVADNVDDKPNIGEAEKQPPLGSDSESDQSSPEAWQPIKSSDQSEIDLDLTGANKDDSEKVETKHSEVQKPDTTPSLGFDIFSSVPSGNDVPGNLKTELTTDLDDVTEDLVPDLKSSMETVESNSTVLETGVPSGPLVSDLFGTDVSFEPQNSKEHLSPKPFDSVDVNYEFETTENPNRFLDSQPQDDTFGGASESANKGQSFLDQHITDVCATANPFTDSSDFTVVSANDSLQTQLPSQTMFGTESVESTDDLIDDKGTQNTEQLNNLNPFASDNQNTHTDNSNPFINTGIFIDQNQEVNPFLESDTKELSESLKPQSAESSVSFLDNSEENDQTPNPFVSVDDTKTNNLFDVLQAESSPESTTETVQSGSPYEQQHFSITDLVAHQGVGIASQQQASVNDFVDFEIGSHDGLEDKVRPTESDSLTTDALLDDFVTVSADMQNTSLGPGLLKDTGNSIGNAEKQGELTFMESDKDSLDVSKSMEPEETSSDFLILGNEKSQSNGSFSDISDGFKESLNLGQNIIDFPDSSMTDSQESAVFLDLSSDSDIANKSPAELVTLGSTPEKTDPTDIKQNDSKNMFPAQKQASTDVHERSYLSELSENIVPKTTDEFDLKSGNLETELMLKESDCSTAVTHSLDSSDMFGVTSSVSNTKQETKERDVSLASPEIQSSTQGLLDFSSADTVPTNEFQSQSQRVAGQGLLDISSSDEIQTDDFQNQLQVTSLLDIPSSQTDQADDFESTSLSSGGLTDLMSSDLGKIDNIKGHTQSSPGGLLEFNSSTLDQTNYVQGRHTLTEGWLDFPSSETEGAPSEGLLDMNSSKPHQIDVAPSHPQVPSESLQDLSSSVPAQTDDILNSPTSDTVQIDNLGDHSHTTAGGLLDLSPVKSGDFQSTPESSSVGLLNTTTDPTHTDVIVEHSHSTSEGLLDLTPVAVTDQTNVPLGPSVGLLDLESSDMVHTDNTETLMQGKTSDLLDSQSVHPNIPGIELSQQKDSNILLDFPLPSQQSSADTSDDTFGGVLAFTDPSNTQDQDFSQLAVKAKETDQSALLDVFDSPKTESKAGDPSSSLDGLL